MCFLLRFFAYFSLCVVAQCVELPCRFICLRINPYPTLTLTLTLSLTLTLIKRE
jgi:hypothetical protein